MQVENIHIALDWIGSTSGWIGLDWIHKWVDWIGLDPQVDGLDWVWKMAHVRFWSRLHTNNGAKQFETEHFTLKFQLE